MKFTIFKRLAVSYMVFMLFVVFLAGYMTLKINQINKITHSIAFVSTTTIGLVERILDSVSSQVGFEKKYLISKDKDFLAKFLEIQGDVIKYIRRLEQSDDDSEKKVLCVKVRQLYDHYVFLFNREADLFAAGQSYPKMQYQEERERVFADINQKLRQIIYVARSQRDRMIEESTKTSFHMVKVVIVTSVSAIILGMLVSILTTRGINQAILLLQQSTADIARGRFEKVPDITSPPEIKALADDFNIMCNRLRELDQMKIDFISHVSHDLRTPLTAIREASSMLLEGTYAASPEKQHELLTITKEECERLIDSVNKILDLSRMEAKMMDYQFRKCSLAHVIQRGVLKVAPIALSKNVSLELDPPPDIPPVNMDEERIYQVIQNLIGNALKYTTDGDSIVIAISLSDNDKNFIEVSISDTGCGIHRDHLGLIFDKFRRIDSDMETESGTGLGLSISKHIITAHGGKIWAESEPGKGSTFYFTLPVSS